MMSRYKKNLKILEKENIYSKKWNMMRVVLDW